MQGQGRSNLISIQKSFTTWNSWQILILACIFILALTARLIPGPRTIDDAYITFRYARNILAGNGFVYNPGEQVLGTTTPLFAILLVGLSAPAGGPQAPFPEIAMLVNALADAITCLLLYGLGRRLGSPRAGVGAALAWAVAPFSVTFAIGGLETSVYVLLLTAAASAYLHGRQTLAAALASLSLLTRPDALLLIGPLAFDRLIAWIKAERRASKRQDLAGAAIDTPHVEQPISPNPSSLNRALALEILIFLVPLIAWSAFAAFYFGNPIPQSVAAKSMAYRLPPEAGLVRLMQHYATPFNEHLTFGIPWIGIGLVLYPFLYLIGVRMAMRKTTRAWPFFLFPWLYFAAFAIANPLIFRWYLTTPLPAYFLGILLGADRLLTDVSNWWKTRQGIPGRKHNILDAASGFLPLFFVVLAPALLLSRGWVLQPDHGIERPAPDMAWYRLELHYQQAAAILSQRLRPGDVLAAGDVGALGYYTDARILDTVGLNSPQTLKYYPLDASYYAINYAIPPDLILDEHPDYLVILEVYGREGLLKDPRFWEGYSLLEKIPTDIYGSDGMLIFARMNSP